jgi:hypothetical protein
VTYLNANRHFLRLLPGSLPFTNLPRFKLPQNRPLSDMSTIRPDGNSPAFIRAYPPGIAIRYPLSGQGSVSRKSFMARRTSASLERKT